MADLELDNRYGQRGGAVTRGAGTQDLLHSNDVKKAEHRMIFIDVARRELTRWDRPT